MSPFVMHLWAATTGEYPVVVSESSGGTSSLTSPVPVTKPASLAEGNTLLLAFRNDSPTHTGGDDFTKLFSLHHAVDTSEHLSVWTKTVTASEAASFDFAVTSSGRAGWWVIQFEGDVDFSYATNDDGVDPPNLSITGDAAKTMWLAVMATGASDQVLTNPTDYTDQLRGASDSNSADTRTACACARKESDAASENPATWTYTNTVHDPVSATIGVRVAP